MTRIGLMSDTHGDLDERIFEHFWNVDEIWHAGDIGNLAVTDRLAEFKPVKAVYGNIDGAEIRRVHPEHQRFQCEDKSVWITHIGGKTYKYDRRVQADLKSNPPDIFVCGHSHILRVGFDKNLQMLYLNPGACGNKGFHKVKTLLRFAIDDKTVKDMEVIELGKRV